MAETIDLGFDGRVNTGEPSFRVKFAGILAIVVGV
jgi:hypothetical protein